MARSPLARSRTRISLTLLRGERAACWYCTHLHRRTVHINRKLCPCGAYLLPYTVLLLFSGMVIGWVHRFWLCPAGILDSFGGLGHSINKWRTINPHYVLYLFLPPLIFASAHHVDYHVISRSIVHIGYLATVGVVISAILTALVAKYCFWWYEFNWWTALTFGSMLAATDPVAVVALLADLGAPKTLSLLIEGESLFNDGTACVASHLVLRPWAFALHLALSSLRACAHIHDVSTLATPPPYRCVTLLAGTSSSCSSCDS